MNWNRLTFDEKVAAVFLGLVFVHLIIEAQRVDTPARSTPHPTQEEFLQHLENGHTVTVDRWHGSEVTLQAVDQDVEEVVDVPSQVEEEDE